MYIILVSNVESPKDDPYLADINAICDEFHPVPWTERRKYSFAFYLNVVLKSFSRYPVTVINDYSRKLESTLEQILMRLDCDLLICDYLQPSLNFKGISGFPLLLFQHNVESVIMRRSYENASNSLIRFFWWTQWKKMLAYEKKVCRKFDGVVTVSELDKQILEDEFSAKHVFAIPTGVNTEYFCPSNENPTRHNLVFTGAMDWLANEDGILFFTTDILPRIKIEIPDVSLTVVGRNPSQRLLRRIESIPEIKVVGRVDDVRPYMSQSAVYIIPLRIGGGTRIKAYEAMAMAKAVVSTSVGIEGLPVVNDENIMIADRAEEFARKVVLLLKNDLLRQKIGKSARDFVVKNCGWERAADDFARICGELISSKQMKELSTPSSKPAGKPRRALRG